MNKRIIKTCQKHGEVIHVYEPRWAYFRCQRCRNDHVIEHRRKIKRRLVEEAGGKCAICGYDKFFGSLQFHHIDPKQKSFGLAQGGRSNGYTKMKQEANKCVLLCANCHHEVEGGVSKIPEYAN